MWAVDVNERARALCAANAARNGITNVAVRAPDDVPPAVRFATLWSNPAIRIGKPALHEMLRRWLDRLTSNGEAIMVVHKHLGSDSLQAWLTAQGYPTRRGWRVRVAIGSCDPYPTPRLVLRAGARAAGWAARSHP